MTKPETTKDIEDKLDSIIDLFLASVQDLVVSNIQDSNPFLLKARAKEALASDVFAERDDSTSWMPLTVDSNGLSITPSESQLKKMREVSRQYYPYSEVLQNVIGNYVSHLVGSGLRYAITPKNIDDDIAVIMSGETKVDGKTKKMREIWNKFVETNKFDSRSKSMVVKAERDGEYLVRLFKVADNVQIRFIDPSLLKSDDPDVQLGIETEPNDVETPKSYRVKAPGQQKEDTVPAQQVVHGKRNVDFDVLRGIPSGVPIFRNIRRVEKILVNASSLVAIQTSIAMIRTHKNNLKPEMGKFLNKNTTVNSSTGRREQVMRPGSILDNKGNIEYEFPGHNVKADGWISILHEDLARVSSRFHQPIEWLLGKETESPLELGSPFIKHFIEKREELYSEIEEIFWKVIGLMLGEDAALKNREKYKFRVFGPILGMPKGLDAARMYDILIKHSAMSNQELAIIYGFDYTTSRKNIIQHRKTKQPDEQFPGDVGNTNPSDKTDNGGDGVTKKGPASENK